MPEIKTIPVSEVPSLTGSSLSREDRDIRELFDNALKNLPAGQAGVIKLDEQTAKASRSTQMRIRAAAKRTGVTIARMGQRDGNVYFVVDAPAKGK